MLIKLSVKIYSFETLRIQNIIHSLLYYFPVIRKINKIINSFKRECLRRKDQKKGARF
jgi:hypothetical protein